MRDNWNMHYNTNIKKNKKHAIIRNITAIWKLTRVSALAKDYQLHNGDHNSVTLKYTLVHCSYYIHILHNYPLNCTENSLKLALIKKLNLVVEYY